MNTELRVLIVEDDRRWQEIARKALAPYAAVVIAGSVSAALQELKSNPHFTLAILDGRVPRFEDEPLGKNDTTLMLARRIVGHYKIPAYSASSDEDLNEKLAESGCIRTTKQSAAERAREALVALIEQ